MQSTYDLPTESFLLLLSSFKRYVAALWSIVVLLSAIFLPIIRICLKINKLKATGGQKKDALKDNKNAKFGGYTTRDARVYLLLLLSFLIFAVTLFLIHFGRVIDVPQGHSMFTYWMFFSCYFFGTSMLYWSRMVRTKMSPLNNIRSILKLVSPPPPSFLSKHCRTLHPSNHVNLN